MQSNVRARGTYGNIEEIPDFEILPCLGQSSVRCQEMIAARTAFHCGMSPWYLQVTRADMRVLSKDPVPSCSTLFYDGSAEYSFFVTVKDPSLAR